MTFFEQELNKLFGKEKGLQDVRIVGNACYGRLSRDIRVKIHFITGSVADHYEALKVTLINRCEGPIDSMVLRFRDTWGVKKVSNPNFRDGISPHIWQSGRETEWYVYRPSQEDYGQLSKAVNDYLEVFREPVQEHHMEQKMG